jgi:hypothetical protein
MKIQTVLRICVWLVLVLFLTGSVVGFLLHGSLPPQLRDWHAPRPERVSSVLLLGGAGALVFFSWVAALVGLLRLKRWAAWLFLFSLVSGYAYVALTGPTVAHGVASAIDGVSAVLSGMVLALAFFSNALRPDLRAEPGAAPNGGPAAPLCNPGPTGGPPSVS